MKKSNNIEKIAKKAGFTVKGQIAYKKVRDYLVTISYTSTNHLRCCISVDAATTVDLDKRAITRFINSNYAKYKIIKFRWDESGIDVTFQKDDSKLFECFTDFVMEVTSELLKCNCKGVQACAICERPNNADSSLFYLYGFICGVHKSCMAKYDEETNVTKINNKKYDRGNLGSGIFGALWGAFIGSLALLIGFAFFQQESIREWLFIAAVLVPIVVKFYYEVLDGSSRALTKFIVVSIVSLSATVAAMALGNAIHIYSQTKEFIFEWETEGTLKALGVCGATLLLLNYRTIKLKGVKQAYKLD